MTYKKFSETYPKDDSYLLVKRTDRYGAYYFVGEYEEPRLHCSLPHGGSFTLDITPDMEWVEIEK